MIRIRRLIVCLALVMGVCAAVTAAAAIPLRVVDLDGAPFDLERTARDAPASVFVFTAIDCPIANRYAPELKRLAAAFAARGVRMWLVFADPANTAEAIRAHLRRFDVSIPALRDPSHDLVRFAGAMISPEAALVDRKGRVVYHGRIDDRWVDFGRDRPAPTRRDLEDAVTALLEGRPIVEPVTQAVGCYLADFRQ